MSTPHTPRSLRELVQRTRPAPKPPPPSPEEELDSLISAISSRRLEDADKDGGLEPDAIEALRGQTIDELIPVFVELVEKYSESGVSLQMDASNFLEGGREIRFEFSIGDYNTQLLGTVTTEAIAFHETRYSPDVQGELLSGPMLRLRGLDGRTFRDFICQRLTLLIRAAARRRY